MPIPALASGARTGIRTPDLFLTKELHCLRALRAIWWATSDSNRERSDPKSDGCANFPSRPFGRGASCSQPRHIANQEPQPDYPVDGAGTGDRTPIASLGSSNIAIMRCPQLVPNDRIERSPPRYKLGLSHAS